MAHRLASNKTPVAGGVDLATLGRRWGRAGVVFAVVSLCACSSATAPLSHDAAPPATASRGNDAVQLGVPPLGGPGEVAIAPPPADFSGPPPAPAPAPAALATPNPAAATASAPGLWSVVIGINDYPGSGHDLEYAGNDARDADGALGLAGEPSDRRVDLRDGQATGGNIRRSLDWLVAHAGPGTTAVFFYAGHIRKLSANHEAMVGADGDVVSDVEMAQHLARLRATHTWIVMAGCYGGGFTEVLGPGRILTAAAPANQLAYETTTYHRSYLVEYMIHRGMLEGLGGPSVQSAYAYAYNALRAEHPDRLPVEYDDIGQPLVLASSPTSAPPPQPAASASTSGPPPRSSASSTTSTTQASQPKRQCLITAGSTIRCPND